MLEKSLVRFELLDLFSNFVSRMDTKREKDYKYIEKVYQDMTTGQRKQLVNYEKQRVAKETENEGLRRIIHSLKTKLASDFTVICNLRREIEFVREHSRIIQEENTKITAAMQKLFSDIKELDLTTDNLKPHFEAFQQTRLQGKKSVEYLAENYHSQVEAGLNPKQKHELNRMMTQDDLPYEGFFTLDKACCTANLISENTVTVNFSKVSIKAEVAHIGTQKIDLKPRSKEFGVQVNIANWENLTHRPGSSKDDDSVKDSAYKRKIMDRYKIEHMLVGSDRKSVLVKQTSIIPDTITELMEISKCYEDEDNYHPNPYQVSGLPSETDVILELPKGRGKAQSRSGRVSFSLKPPVSHQNLKTPNQEMSEDKASNSRDHHNFTSAAKNTEKLGVKGGSSVQRLKRASNRIITSHRTINSFKPDISGSPIESNHGSIIMDRSPKTLVEMDNLESYRETKLRNELIRQKQQYKTLSNRMASCGDDQEKTAQINAMLESAAGIIDKLEKQLRNVKKAHETAEKMSQFRPAPTPTIASNFHLARTEDWRAQHHQSSPEKKQLHDCHGQ
jgi:hypothetical protein